MIAALRSVIAETVNDTVNRYIEGTITHIYDDTLDEVPEKICSNLSYISDVTFEAASIVHSSAFNDCKNITSLSFPRCEVVEASAFASAIGSCSEIYFPNCKTVGEGGFKYGGFSKAIFPECTYVSSWGFQNCENVSVLEFPKLNTVSCGAFIYNEALEYINFPNLEYINDAYAFASCYNVSYIDLPKLKQLSYANSCFESIGTIDYVSMPNLEIMNGRSVFREDYFSELDLPRCSYMASEALRNAWIDYVKVPKLVFNEYSDGLFRWARIKKLEIGTWSSMAIPADFLFGVYTLESLTGYGFTDIVKIGTSAFYGCNNLKNIRLDSCSYIGSYAFQNCRSLTTMNLPECTKIGSFAFAWCSNIVTFDAPKLESIPDSYEEVDYHGDKRYNGGAFLDCINLQAVLMSNCSYVGSGAFYRCSSLSGINLPNCNAIGAGAFSNCTNLSYAYFKEVRKINERTFYNCFKLQSVDLTNCIEIGGNAFAYCSALSEIEIPNNFTVNAILSSPVAGQATRIAPIFTGCVNLKTLKLNGISSMTEDIATALLDGLRLTTLEMNSLKVLGSSVFGQYWRGYGNTIRDLGIENCERIEDDVFWVDYTNANMSMTNLYLPKCSYIGSRALAGLYSVTEFNIGPTEYIGAGAFVRDGRDLNRVTGWIGPSRTIIINGDSVATIVAKNEFATWYDSFNPITGKIDGERFEFNDVAILVKESLYEQYKATYSSYNFCSRIFINGADKE